MIAVDLFVGPLRSSWSWSWNACVDLVEPHESYHGTSIHDSVVRGEDECYACRAGNWYTKNSRD